ncbi:hypothetical protein [Actinomadura monticuli]|uniref:Uncharacterized protein n=1 Tax=Actinomadura monticuli TaxID=3097367 RepID=A0ABV4QD58_9ACTN
MDGFVQNSEVARSLAGPWLDGSSSFTDDVARLLGSVDTAGVRDLTLSALLLRLIKSGGPDASGFQDLLDTARRLGVADAPLSEINGTALTSN